MTNIVVKTVVPEHEVIPIPVHIAPRNIFLQCPVESRSTVEIIPSEFDPEAPTIEQVELNLRAKNAEVRSEQAALEYLTLGQVLPAQEVEIVFDDVLVSPCPSTPDIVNPRPRCPPSGLLDFSSCESPFARSPQLSPIHVPTNSIHPFDDEDGDVGPMDDG